MNEPRPILASDASRAWLRRYSTTSTDAHELVADEIHVAENRGVMAVLAALGAQVTDAPRRLIVPSGHFDGQEFQRRLDRELGRTTKGNPS